MRIQYQNKYTGHTDIVLICDSIIANYKWMSHITTQNRVCMIIVKFHSVDLRQRHAAGWPGVQTHDKLLKPPVPQICVVTTVRYHQMHSDKQASVPVGWDKITNTDNFYDVIQSNNTATVVHILHTSLCTCTIHWNANYTTCTGTRGGPTPMRSQFMCTCSS